MPAPVAPSAALGLAWRPISLDDIDVWHDLVCAIDMHDEPEQRVDRDDLVEELVNGSHKDPARDTLIGLHPDGVARAFGHVELLPGKTLRRVFMWGGVHPGWRRRGIGGEVLRWQTERAHEALAEQELGDDPEIATLPWMIMVR